MRWGELPLGARRYILYHTIVSPLLITWYMLPLYLYMTGYQVLEVGIIYTLVEAISIPVTYFIGKAFTRIAIRHGLIAIDGIEGISNFIYSLAYGPLAPLILLVGLLLNNIARMFYPLYQAAERLLYPEGRMEEVFAWHIRLPEASQLIGFLALGYIFGHIFNTPSSYRIGFLAIGLSSIFTITFLETSLPRMDIKEELRPNGFKFKVDREFRVILLLDGLAVIAWSLAPEIVLLNYIVNVLKLTLFEAMVVEASISVGAILATYVSERIARKHRFKAMAAGYIFVSLWALIMYFNPPFTLVIIAYFISRFGDTLAFPFYRAWIFSKIPKGKATTLTSALSSYRRLIALATPALAGFLASIKPTLPYLASLMVFSTLSLVLVIYSYRETHSPINA